MARVVRKKAAVVLGENVEKLMKARGLRQTDLRARTGVPQTTISRVLKKARAARVDSIEALARGCALEAWQLLVPDMDPKRPPTLCYPGHEHPPRFTELILQIAELLEERGESAQRAILELLEGKPPPQSARPIDATDRRAANT